MIVLDAAALVDVLIDRPWTGWVLGVVEGTDVCAPAHQPAEVLSALSRLRRADVLDDATLAEAVEEFVALPQEIVTPSAAHLRRALSLSGRVRVLDSLYVALAEERSCPLVTTDQRLAAAALPCEVLAPPPDTP